MLSSKIGNYHGSNVHERAIASIKSSLQIWYTWSCRPLQYYQHLPIRYWSTPSFSFSCVENQHLNKELMMWNMQKVLKIKKLICCLAKSSFAKGGFDSPEDCDSCNESDLGCWFPRVNSSAAKECYIVSKWAVNGFLIHMNVFLLNIYTCIL